MTTPVTELVHLDRADGVATITLDSPSNRNALSAPLQSELAAHLETAVQDDDVRAIVLTATGTVFCSGADLKGTQPSAGAMYPDLLLNLLQASKPVIAALNGAVRAGGIGLVASCDIVVAPADATFAFAEVRIGVAPAIIGVVCLRRMPPLAASRYFLTGEVFTAEEAVAAGLVTIACPGEEVAARVVALTDEIRRTAPGAVAETKRLLTELPARSLTDAFALAASTSARLFASEEAQAGIAAFRERRPAPWDPAARER